MSDLPQEQTPFPIPVTKKALKNNARLLNSPKFRKWVELFFDENNKETFGHKTNSALQAYGLDKKTQYFSAANIGLQNFKKLENVAGAYLEKKGVTFGKMLDVAVSNMVKTRSPIWYNYIAKHAGLEELMVEQEGPSTVNNIQVNNFNGTPEEKKDYNKDMQAWLESGGK